VTVRHRVVGVDLSMGNTGVAVIRPNTDHEPGLYSVKTGPDRLPAGADPYPAMRNRLRTITARILRAGRFEREDDELTLWVLEGPSLGSGTTGKQIHQHTRAGLWWQTYNQLALDSGLVAVVPPKTLKSYVAKNGNADKVKMMEAAVGQAFPGIDFRGDDNLVDAYGLAAMGCRELGYPVEPSPQRVNPGALAAVRWPASTSLARSIT
jgi:hypothetical protein